LLVGELHAAEDLVQTALERAYRKWDRVRSSDSPEAYVRKIVVNLANDRWSRIKRRPEAPMIEDRVATGDPFAVVDLRDQLVRALFALPIGMRTVLVLRFFDGLPDDQIAATLRLSAATVRSQSARGMAKLRELIAADGGAGETNVIHIQFGGAA
jgi:RNA polymerase sigma-70 factor (sigma-E family)